MERDVRLHADVAVTAGGPGGLACMQEACELLWPPPAVVTVAAGEPGRPGRDRGLGRPAAGSEFALVPGIRRAPLLVPADGPAAAAAIRHYGGSRSAAVRLALRGLSLGLGGGLGSAALRSRVRVSAPPGADTIEGYLAGVLSRDIRLSMRLGPARANRKPVLQLLADGEPAGFAKIGVSPLTRRLVRAEHDSLVRLGRAGLAEITIPRVLHYGRWHDLEVLVLNPLPAWLPRRPLAAARLAVAMAELARVGGLRHEPLGGSGYLARLRSRLAAVGLGPEQAALRHALDTLSVRAGGEVLAFGAWHGDWVPWNMACTSRGLLVWDWERFTDGVPLGFDALHHGLQTEVVTRHREPLAAASRCTDHAACQLAPLGISARQARLTVILYLADLAVRYLADRQAQAGARLGAAGTWLIPAITCAVAQLGAGPSRSALPPRLAVLTADADRADAARA